MRNEAAENSSDGSAARRRTCAGRERPGEIGVPIMIRLLEISNHMLFWYYLASNLAYLTMLIVALKTSAAHQRSLKSHRLAWFKESPLAPPITIIAPAHNEEKSIRVAVRNLLELDYPQLEVIVVNDGSRTARWRKCVKSSGCGRSGGVHTRSGECAGAGFVPQRGQCKSVSH